MGDYCQYQPLTEEDKKTVIIYRIGIILSGACVMAMAILAQFVINSGIYNGIPRTWLIISGGLLYGLFVSIGLSVFFIHLYINSIHKMLKKMYIATAICFIFLCVSGGGNPMLPVLFDRHGPLLLLPLSGCLGFITAKEAFCFRLTEGYLLALIMPVYLCAATLGLMSQAVSAAGIIFIALLLVFFALRKVFMPIHCDIGDKSAYQ